MDKEKLKVNTAFGWKNKGFLERLDVSVNFLFSLLVSTMILLSLFLTNKACASTDTRFYFYWLNFIPAGASILIGLIKLNWNRVTDEMGAASTDYILLKTIFKLTEDMQFYVIGCAIGGSFVATEAFKGKRRFNLALLFLYCLELYALTTNLEQFFILLLVTVSQLFTGCKKIKDKEAGMTRIFLMGNFYLIDLLMNMGILKQIVYINLDYIKYVFYAYSATAALFIAIANRLEYFSNAFAFVNLVWIGGYVVVNESRGVQINFIDEYTAIMALVASFGLLSLTHIYSRSKITRIFPPKHQGLYDFTYFSLEHFISSTTYDHMVIEIKRKFLLPRLTTNEKVRIKIGDLKLACFLHVLNELVRQENVSEIDLNDSRVFARLNNFKESFCHAIEATNTHYDALDKEIEGAIQSIIDVNNDVFSKFLFFVGFYKISWSLGLGFLFCRNTFLDERNEIAAIKIESDINRGEMGNIVSGTTYIGEADES